MAAAPILLPSRLPSRRGAEFDASASKGGLSAEAANAVPHVLELGHAPLACPYPAPSRDDTPLPHRVVGNGQPALVIAEIGQNHNGSLALAEQLIDAAAWAGAEAVKFVKRDLDCELAREARERPYDSPHAFGATYGSHRKALELSVADHDRLAQRAWSHGLLFFCTACDQPSVEQLARIGVDAFKVASRDLPNFPLVREISRQGRPVLISTGMSSWAEIDLAVRILRREQTAFVLCHCTSLYPTPPAESHLRSLPELAKRYDALAGFSDHTTGILLPPVAAALGAVTIEKHLTLDRNLKGTDHSCSLEPEELRRMIENVRAVEAALGRADKPLASGVAAVRAKLGRSLVTRSDLAAGTSLEESMLTLKCPGDGLTWLDLKQVLGRTLRRDLPADEMLNLDDLQ